MHHNRATRTNARFTLATALIATLAACGGGGSDGSSSASAADPIDKYMGIIVANCHQETWITDAATGAAQYVRTTMKGLTKSSATNALVEYTHDIYGTSDCSGTPRKTLTVSGADSFLSVDGSVVLSAGTADKVTNGEGNKLPGISGTTVQLNDLKVNSKFLAAIKGKDLFLVQGSDVYAGALPLDAQGYPTALAAKPFATKQ